VIRAALVLVVLLAGTARADHDHHQPKKDRLRALKSAKHGAPPRPGTRPARLINIYNSWTHEWLAVEAPPSPRAVTVNRFLRDHFTNEPATMEPKLIAMVVAAATKFRSDTAIVVSAFRHPKYNLMLRKKGRQVARDSAHTHGNAVDFYIPRIATQTLHAWAKEQAAGGVGLYLESGFVHMDTGKIRYWSGD
jgi:uncharacterized protein YcbK (DUF882 family)